MDANTQFLSEHHQRLSIAFAELCVASQGGELSKVQKIIEIAENQSILNALTPELGLTALMLAAERGHLGVVNLLIDKKVLLNLKSNFGVGYTALMYAVAHGQYLVAEALLKAGADPCLSSSDGETALKFAEYNEHSNMIVLLNRHIPQKSEPTLTVYSLLKGLACFVPSFDFSKFSNNTNTMPANKSDSEKTLESKDSNQKRRIQIHSNKLKFE